MNLPPYITAFARLLRADLREIKNAIQDQTRAAADARKATEGRLTTPPEVVARLRTDDHLIVETHPKDKQGQSIQSSIRWATWCAVFAASAYAFVAILQWCEMKKATEATARAANAASSSAETARKTLVATNRPWVGVDGSPTYDLEKGDFSVTAKNSGIGPALNVGIMMKSSVWENFDKEIVSVCGHAKDKTKSGSYIFPSSTYSRRFVEVGGSLPPESTFILMGCIAYFGESEDFHHTEFCFTSGLPLAKTKKQALTPCAIRQNAD